MAIIYCITNTTNKKKYIGTTRCSIQHRLFGKPYGHVYLAFNPKPNGKMSMMNLHKAIREQGFDMFSYEILEEREDIDFISEEELYLWLDERERFYINKFDTMTFGYNETSGGRKGYTRSISNRQKTSETTKAAMSLLDTKTLCNPKKGRTEEEIQSWKAKISDSVKSTMSSLDTKTLCNPKKSKTEEEIQSWKAKISNSSSIKAKMQWSDPEKRKRLLEARKGCQKGMKTLYKDGVKHRFKAIEVEQAIRDGWLPKAEYLAKGGDE